MASSEQPPQRPEHLTPLSPELPEHHLADTRAIPLTAPAPTRRAESNRAVTIERTPIASAADLAWGLLAVIAGLLALACWALACTSARAGAQFDAGAGAYAAFGLALFAVVVFLAGHSPLGALVAGLLTGVAPGLVGVLVAGGLGPFASLSATPFGPGLKDALASGIPLAAGGAACALAVTLAIGRARPGPQSATKPRGRWLVALFVAGCMIPAQALFVFADRDGSRWLIVAAAIVVAAAAWIAHLAPLPAALAGTILGLAPGAALLVWTATGHLPHVLAEAVGGAPALTGSQLTMTGLAVLAAALASAAARPRILDPDQELAAVFGA